jgi:prepilin-type N-terminal cleavage/methylation domain-containing protein
MRSGGFFLLLGSRVIHDTRDGGRTTESKTMKTKRRGFTLVETLVVITIIAILMTLSLQVVGGALEQSRVSATQATISKIQGMINQRAQALDRQILRKGFLSGSLELASVKKKYPAIPSGTQDILAKKILEIRYFPQRPADLYDGGLYPASAGLSAANSGEIFFFFVTQTAIGDTPLGTDAFTSAEVGDENKNGLQEFKDAWGTPLRFYRWPTRLFRSGGQNGPHSVAGISQQDILNARSFLSTLPVFSGNLANDLAHDPHDPLRSCLYDLSNFETATVSMDVSPVTNILNPATTPLLMHTPGTYHVYMIVSAGPDKTFGMGDPADTAAFGYLGAVTNPEALRDDIVSLSIRPGGK